MTNESHVRRNYLEEEMNDMDEFEDDIGFNDEEDTVPGSEEGQTTNRSE